MGLVCEYCFLNDVFVLIVSNLFVLIYFVNIDRMQLNKGQEEEKDSA